MTEFDTGTVDASRSGLYPRTRAAFGALITAEIATSSLLSAAERLQETLKDHPDRASFSYVRPPRPRDDAQMRVLIEQRRKEVPRHFATLQKVADDWHESECEFREAVEKAKAAADHAAIELDTPSIPPLQRTSIAIKRALHDLSGSVPYPITSGWAEGAVPVVIDRIREQYRGLQRWTEELKLLVRPEHTLPPPSAPSMLPDGSPEPPSTVRPSESDNNASPASGTDRSGAVLDQQSPGVAQASAHAQTSHEVSALNSFLRKGGGWRITFEGRECHCEPRRGLDYLQRLLRAPLRPVSVEDLAAIPEELRPQHVEPQEMTDKDGLKACYEDLKRIGAALDEAAAVQDELVLGELQQERESLLSYIQASTGRGGEPRAMPDEGERIRQQVGRALSLAIKYIAKKDDRLASHLLGSIRQLRGRTPCYAPESEVHWLVDDADARAAE